jgi:hypothetical protein
MLIEICCRCGFVHRDDRTKYRSLKPHYHWTPESALVKDGTKLHATICASCVGMGTEIDWKEFFEARALTPQRYRVEGSLNAPLPDKYLALASELYATQSKYFLFIQTFATEADSQPRPLILYQTQ